MTTNQIIWTQLPNETSYDRTNRINRDLHRIFFDFKEVCPERFIEESVLDGARCHICKAGNPSGGPIIHITPRFLESLDAMQLIVESGKFAEVREEYYHWLESGKPKYGCRILIYRQIGNQQMKRIMFFEGKGSSRQEAFYVTALRAMGYEVVQESQGESNV